jgi:hypothetical protein
MISRTLCFVACPFILERTVLFASGFPCTDTKKHYVRHRSHFNIQRMRQLNHEVAHIRNAPLSFQLNPDRTTNSGFFPVRHSSPESFCRSAQMFSELQDPIDDDDSGTEQKGIISALNRVSQAQSYFQSLLSQLSRKGKPPPIQVEDINVLLFDTILIINLAVAISYFVIQRMNLGFVGLAFNEGCLMSLFWITSGLYTGAFLYSAVDGHYGSSNTDQGGPKGAGILAAHTYVNAINMRLLFALIASVCEHRPVGSVLGEQIMLLEIGFGLLLLVLWRMLYSNLAGRM